MVSLSLEQHFRQKRMKRRESSAPFHIMTEGNMRHMRCFTWRKKMDDVIKTLYQQPSRTTQLAQRPWWSQTGFALISAPATVPGLNWL
jgi:hypothetical protein